MPAPLEYLVTVEGTSDAVGELEGLEGAIDRVDQTAEKASKSQVTMYGSISQAALGFGTAASGAFALFSQYDQLEKLQLRIVQANKAHDQATRGVIDAEQALHDLEAKGVVSGAQYESALIRVSTAHQQLDIAAQKANMSQQDLTQGQVGFALSIAPTVFGAISGITSAMTALRAIQTASAAAQATTIPVTVADVGAKSALAGAVGTAATATGGLTLATRLLHIAMGPVGWIILGVGTFLALFATNAFGVRDAINAMGKAIGDAIPILRPLLDALASLANTIFPETKDSSKEASDEMTGSFQNVNTEYSQLMKSVEQNSAAMAGSFDATGASYQQLAGTAQTESDRIANALKLTSTDGASSLKALDSAFSTTANSIASSAKKAERAVKELTEALRDLNSASKSSKTDTLKHL
jgi:hypothetical protein